MMRAHCGELVRRDHAFNDIVLSAALCPFGRVRPKTTHFESLVRAVIAQQVSTAAARTITARMTTLAGGSVTPESMAGLSDAQLQSAGLTSAKVRSLAELSRTAASGAIDFRRISRQPDDVVITELTAVYGIGVWTAQMFLMFQLGRLDVWPTGDLAVRRGWDVLHPAVTDTAPSPEAGALLGRRGAGPKVAQRKGESGTSRAGVAVGAEGTGAMTGVPATTGVTARELDRLGETFVGLRSIAAWYCWRAS